jgi:hypothetical protein
MLASINKFDILHSKAQAMNVAVDKINTSLKSLGSQARAVAGKYGIAFVVSVTGNKLGISIAEKEYRFATGGILSEPVIGIGQKTGAVYHLAEQGPEKVVPLGASAMSKPASLSAGGDTHLHFYQAHPNPEEIMADLTWWWAIKGWSN